MSRILIVDDDTSFIEAIREIIKMLGHQAITAQSVETAKSQLKQCRFDILILDIMLPDGSGFEVLENLSADERPRHIAFVTGHTVVKTLARAIAGPDTSFLLKPINLEKIKSLLNRANNSLPRKGDEDCHFNLLIGEAPSMQKLYKMIERVAGTRANVMIQGESGTGKELVANAIHNASGCSGPFVAANCGAITSELIGSELFGHEKGSFTGAVARKIGLFERAEGGTLFLDEITEMPIDLQPNLLRVLETGYITRLGGSKEIPVNCRVISATNRTSEQMANEQCLREDLYFRLAVFPIQVPPLSHRMEDIPLLCHNFLKDLNQEYGTEYQLDQPALDKLMRYSWPGNVRELRHAIHRAFIMSDADSTYIELPDDLSSPFSNESNNDSTLAPGRTIQDMEKELISVTMEQVGNNKPKAAEMLGISLKTLYNRLNQYGDSSAELKGSPETQ